MNKKFIVGTVIFMAVTIIAVKVYLIANSPSVFVDDHLERFHLHEDIERELNPNWNIDEQIVNKAFLVQKLAAMDIDRNIRISLLEDLEKRQKNSFLADRLRRAVLALRFNKPVDNYTKDELKTLLLESKRSM